VAYPGLKPHRTRDESVAGFGLHKPENHAIDHAKPPQGGIERANSSIEDITALKIKPLAGSFET